MTRVPAHRIAARRRRRVAEIIATAFIDGAWHPPLMAGRAAHDLGLDRSPRPMVPPRWLADQAALVTAEWPDPVEDPRPLANRLRTELDQLEPEDDQLLRWMNGIPRVPGSSWEPPKIFRLLTIAMDEPRWPVRTIDTVGDLARMFGLDVNELLWYADVKSLERSVESENLRHYSYRWVPKQRGGSRLLEIPKQNLKTFQRQILADILNHIPPHRAAHGFTVGRSIQSYVAPHCAQSVVIRLDLRNFFATVPMNQVIAIFRSCGYANEVAHLLAGLTTNSAPRKVLSGHGEDVLRGPHLPQGSPTSPALANLAVYQLDARLTGLAKRFEARYTRYADDLAFSGPHDLLRRSDRFVELVTSIVRDEGYAINPRKTSIRSQSDRQVLTGLVVNQHPNIHRTDYDRLRAILHDASINGATAANRSGHPQFRSYLQGHIGFVQSTNPNRAIKLWRLFDAIDWSS